MAEESFVHRVADLALEPGVVGVLHAGDPAVWRIHETLRKVFQITGPA
ncbi:MAG TPA: hypothetical protein VH650_01660 [Gaiellaceae bacterium]|jgi:uncharacterized cupin superfamily protein